MVADSRGSKLEIATGGHSKMVLAIGRTQSLMNSSSSGWFHHDVGDPNQRKPDRPKVLHVIQLCLI
jgi:hypothetical protein